MASRGARTAWPSGAGSASAFGHGARILGLDGAVARRRAGPDATLEPAGFIVDVETATGSTSSTGAGRRRPTGDPGSLRSTASARPPGRGLRSRAASAAGGPAGSSRWTSAVTASRTPRPRTAHTSSTYMPATSIAVAEGSGLLGRAGRSDRPRWSRVRRDRGRRGRAGLGQRCAGARPRRRRLGVARGGDRHRRRRVPARARRAARGPALDDGVPRRSGGVRSGAPGTPIRSRRRGRRSSRRTPAGSCRSTRPHALGGECPRDVRATTR